jgi:hypothetical protein
MPPFFGTAAGTDPVFEALRLGTHPNSVAARESFEPLWAVAAPFLGTDVPRNAAAQFQQVFWEVYLAAALQSVGKRLIPRDRRGEGGPDLLQSDPEAFYEAIAVTPGATDDAVTEGEPFVARPVPDDPISLRLTSGLSAKLAKYLRYRDNGSVGPNQPFVIAINAGTVPTARLERTVPRIVRTVFPIGDEVVHLDPTTGLVTGTSHLRRSALIKKSGAEVGTSFFEAEGATGISAVLYSCVDPFNGPAELGADFILVRNPHATNHVGPQFLPRSCEFSVDGDQIRGARVPPA